MKTLQWTIFKARNLSINATWILLAMLISTWVNQPVFADSTRIVKWKDEKGVTHYGDKIPPQFSNAENSVINKQGVTVQRNRPINREEEAINVIKLEQDKKDRALLAAFSDESEIELARDRNLQLDEVMLEGLQLQKTNHIKRHAEMQKYATKYKQKKQPIPQDLNDDMQKNQAELSKLNAQIDERKGMMTVIRKRFDDDKARYVALKNYANGQGPKP